MSHANAKARVYYDEKSRVIGLEPESEGKFVLTAHDLCLTPQAPAQGHVIVSDVHKIILKVVDKVGLSTRVL